ncbi:MAG: glycoside hydrolase family 5 protein [Clostridiales bacterium]|nr:glycoside hydrolase family 5 protein [Clostridiales bacterium]
MLTKMGIERGVNLGGWLSQCDYSQERLNHFIKEEDIARIASWGLDHVRIPVDYNVLEDAQGGYDAPGWERIDFALAACKTHGLKAIIDLHKTAGFSFDQGEKESGFFDSAAYQERFCRLWEEIARHYGHLADRVVFELLNEVTLPEYIGEWNRISAEAIRRIRVYAPNTLILVGSYHHNAAHAVKDLAAPADDRVLYNFHCYEPMAYTHQGAGWVPPLVNVRSAFRDNGWTQESFEELFSSAIEAAEKNHTSLYCGEYGVIDVVPTEDALEWFKTIHAVFQKHHIARCVWSYRQMDFGIADPRWDSLRDELLKYL